MKRSRIFCIFAWIIISYFTENGVLNAVTMGSDVLVSRQNYVFFSQTDTVLGLPVVANNTIEGFVLMDQGFGLQNNATALIYNGAFPIVQNMFLNRGTLNLMRNLAVESMVTFTSLGTINGNNHSLTLGLGLDQIGFQNQMSGYFTNLFLTINSSLVLDAKLTFSGISEFNGNNNVVTFDTYGCIAVAPNSELTIKNMTVNNVPDKGLIGNADTSRIILQNVDFVIDSLCTFSTGSLAFVDDVNFLGTGTFVLDSTKTSTINSFSTVRIGDQLCLSLGRNLSAGNQPFYFVDASSALLFDNCYLYIRYPGVNFLRGTLKLDRNVSIDMASTSSAFGMVLGDGVNISNDTTVYYSPSAMSIFNNGWFTYNNVNSNAFTSASNDSKIVRKPGANTYVAKNWNLSNITSVITTYTAVSLQFAPGAILSFNNTDIQLPNVQFNLNGFVSNASYFVLGGGQSLSLSKGSFLLGIQITGTQNSIVGNGKIMGPIIFSDQTAQLIWDALGFIAVTPTLNGGTMILNKNLKLGPNIGLNGPGTINMGTFIMSVDMRGSAWSSPLTLQAGQGGIKLNSNMVLSNIWTVTGSVNIDGQYNSLDMSSSGTLVIAPGSTLNLKNMTLKNVAGSNIHCADDTAHVIFENVETEFTNDFTFNHGLLEFFKINKFKGAHSFIYTSSQPIVVDTQSSITFDTNFIFNYAPVSNAPNLFLFTDNTSKLIFNNALFLVNAQGINFIKGVIEVYGISSLSGLGFGGFNQGITLGDGLTALNDTTLFISNGAQLAVQAGALNYNNVSSSSLVMQNNLSSMFIATNAVLNVVKNMNLGLGVAYFAGQSTLTTELGADIYGSLIPQGIWYRSNN